MCLNTCILSVQKLLTEKSLLCISLLQFSLCTCNIENAWAVCGLEKIAVYAPKINNCSQIFKMLVMKHKYWQVDIPRNSCERESVIFVITMTISVNSIQ